MLSGFSFDLGNLMSSAFIAIDNWKFVPVFFFWNSDSESECKFAMICMQLIIHEFCFWNFDSESERKFAMTEYCSVSNCRVKLLSRP